MDTTPRTVVGRAPVISNITFDKTAPLAGETVTVSATATDPDGDTLAPLTYQWMSGGKPVSAEDKATYTIRAADRRLAVKITASTDATITDPATAEATSAELVPTVVDATHSDLTASATSILADNTTETTLSFTPKDASGQEIAGIDASAVRFGITGLTAGLYTQGAVTKTGNTFTTTLKSMQAGTATVKVSINGIELTGKTSTITLTPLNIIFRIDAPDSAGTMYADGLSLVTAVINIKNNQNNRAITVPSVSFNEVMTHGLAIGSVGSNRAPDGSTQYYANATSVTPGSYKVMASIGGHPITDLGAHITYAFGNKPEPVVNKTGPDDMVVKVLPDSPLVAHANVTGYRGQTGLSAATTGGNTDATHKITYSSSDASKVGVDANTGALTLKVATGSTPVTITASVPVFKSYPDRSLSVTMKVTVLPDSPLVAHANVTGYPGQSGLSAAATGGNTDATHHIVYSSSDASKVSVDANTGALSLKAATGSTPVTITATVAARDGLQAQTAAMTVTVLPDSPLVAHANVTGYPGQSGLSAAATGGNTDATHHIVYSSSDASKVYVDANTGALSLKAATGSTPVTITATVAARDGLQAQTAAMTVTVLPDSPLVAHANVTGSPGQSGLSAAATGGNTDATHHIVYSSSDASKVSVDANTGALTLKAVTGSTPVTIMATVAARDGLQAQTAAMTVTAGPDATHSDLTASATSILADNTTETTLSFTPKDASGQEIAGIDASAVRFGITGLTAGLYTQGAVTKTGNTFTTTLKSMQAGTATVKVSINGIELTGKTSTITLTPLNVTFELMRTTIVGNGTDTVEGRTNPGKFVGNMNLYSPATGLQVKPGSCWWGGGHYRCALISTTPGSYKVTPLLWGKPATELGAHMTYVLAGVTKASADDMVVKVLPDSPLVAHANVTGYPGQSGLSAAATGGNTDATHHIVYSSSDASKVYVDANTGALTLKAVTGSTPVTITATVAARDGLQAQTAAMTVTVLLVWREKSTFVADNAMRWANGHDTLHFTFTPKDVRGQIINTPSLNTRNVVFDYGFGNKSSNFHVQPLVKNSNGTFTQAVTGDTYTAGMRVTPRVKDTDGHILSDNSPSIQMMGPDEHHFDVAISNFRHGQNGDNYRTHEIYLNVTVKDALGHGIPDLGLGDFNIVQKKPGTKFDQYSCGRLYMRSGSGSGSGMYYITVPDCLYHGNGLSDIAFDVGIQGLPWRKTVSLTIGN